MKNKSCFSAVGLGVLRNAALTSVTLLAASGAFAQTSDRAGIGLTPIPVPATTPITVDARRSLAITDQAILSQFSLQETLQAIISRSASPAMNPRALFSQWWGTASNDVTVPLRCNTLDPANPGAASLNRFPYDCPRGEGNERFTDPFSPGPEGYIATGLFNRFDLAASDGSDCGEYRIIFARRSGITLFNQRNVIIFEGVLPNPKPAKGVNGCIRVAEFWAGLSDPGLSPSVRAQQIKSFYLNGLLGFSPVFHPQSYGMNSSSKGQIRTDQFLEFNWMLREFKLSPPNSALATQSKQILTVVPVSVKVNPDESLFAGDPNASKIRSIFQEKFISQLSSLTLPDINRFDYKVDDFANSGQSISMPGVRQINYADKADAAFKTLITAALQRLNLNPSVSAEQVLNRVTALSCGGCHQTSGNSNATNASLGGGLANWPASNVFTHVNENTTDNSSPEGPRFGISPALVNVFLPHRKTVLENYLNVRANLPRCLESCFESNSGMIALCSEICDYQ
jgi:hypothetical protein